MNAINLRRYQLEVRLFLSKRSAKGTHAKVRVIILLRALCSLRVGYRDLQTSVAHISMFYCIFFWGATRNALTSSSKTLGRRCFDYLSDRFGDQEMLLSINLDDKSILQRTSKKFGEVATKK